VSQDKRQTLDYDHILTVLKQKRQQIGEAMVAIERLRLSEMGGQGTPPNWDALQSAEPELTASEPAPPPPPPPPPPPAMKKHVISAAGKKRIIEATKKRWALARAAKEAAGTTITKKVAKAPRNGKTTNKSS
jgi:hypothetical protein